MWNDLTMRQRADVISMAVKAGLRDLDSIRSFYDKSLGSRRFGDGGLTVNQSPIYVKNYPVVNAEDEGLSEYFMNNKNVAGMAIGEGLNGIYGDRRIVLNPYSDVLKTDSQKEGLIKLEAVRHAMSENNYKPSFELSEYQKGLQKTIFRNTPYGSDDEAFKQSLISRELVGDTIGLHLTPEQMAEAARFKFKNNSTAANQKALGGHLFADGGITDDGEEITDTAAELAIGMVPIVGAGYDIYQAYKDPSLSNILIAGSSTILDAINLLSAGTASLPVAIAKGAIKGGVKRAVKEQVVKHAVPAIERSLAGTGRVTHSMHRQAVRTANQNAKDILIKDLKNDAIQQAGFTAGQELFQTKDGKHVWQK